MVAVTSPRIFFKELGSLRELRVLTFAFRAMDWSMQRDFVESLSNMQKIQYISLCDGPRLEADTALWEAASFVLPQPLHYLDLFIFRFSNCRHALIPHVFPTCPTWNCR
jgi:hypothetical protein